MWIEWQLLLCSDRFPCSMVVVAEEGQALHQVASRADTAISVHDFSVETSAVSVFAPRLAGAYVLANLTLLSRLSNHP
jgi:hypothetical protein